MSYAYRTVVLPLYFDRFSSSLFYENLKLLPAEIFENRSKYSFVEVKFGLKKSI